MKPRDELPELAHKFCVYGEILDAPKFHAESGKYRCLVRSHYNELLLVELNISGKDNNAKPTRNEE